MTKPGAPHRLATDVHAHWLLGYGQRQISDLLSRRQDTVDRALERTPATPPQSKGCIDELLLDARTESRGDVQPRCSEALDELERLWKRDYHDLADAIEAVVESLSVECERVGPHLRVRLVQRGSHRGPAGDLARMIEADACSLLRQTL